MAEGILFHIVVDNLQRTFTIDGPDGLNGVCLHLDMLRRSRSRTLSNRFSELYLRMDSHEAVLEEMRSSFPGYSFLGSWLSSQRRPG